MATRDRTQNGSEYSTPAVIVPSKYPVLPDAVVDRFPEISNWQDEQKRLYLQVKQAIESISTEVGLPLDQVQKDARNLSVSVGDMSARLTTETSARIDADGAIVTTLTTLAAVAGSSNTIFVQASAPVALHINDLWFDTDDGLKRYYWNGSAWVDATDAQILGAFAAISTEATARASADSAMATTITTLIATVTTNLATALAAVSTESTARSTGDSALAATISTVSASLTTETTDRTNADNTLSTTITTVSASVTTEATARVNGDAALASSITTVISNYTSADTTLAASISSESSTRASADSSLASSITTVVANYTAADAVISASVTTEASARVAADGSIVAHWGVNLDVNGHVAGFVHLDSTGASSTFIVAVDKFQVTNVNGTITAFDIRSGGGIVMGADVQSDNFAAGSAGWRIERNSGNVEFNNGTFRGDLIAGSIQAGIIRTDCTMYNSADPFRTSPAVSYVVADVASGGAITLSSLPTNPTETQYTDSALIMGAWSIGGTGRLITRITQGTLRFILFINGNSSTGGSGQVVFGPAYRKRNNGGAWGAWTGGSHDNYLTANQQNINYTVSYDLTLTALDEIQFGIRLSKTGTVSGSIGGCVLSAIAFNI